MTMFPTAQGIGGALKDKFAGIFGPGADAPSYESLQRRREIADALMAQTVQQPYRNWGDGVGQVMKALGARFMDNRIGKQEDAERKGIGEGLNSEIARMGGGVQQVIAAMGGGGGGGYSGNPASLSSMGAPAVHQPVAAGAPQAGAPLGRSMPAAGGGEAQAMPYRLPQGGGGNFRELFPQVEQQFRLPGGYLERLAQIESGGNPSAANPNSSAKGLFQFIDSTARQYGVDPMDPVSSTQGAGRLAADNAATLTQALGREPTPGELYLAHQQGAGGAVKLLTNPDAPAAAIVGEDAVRLNGGDASMSARDFAGKWVGKFEGGQGYSGGGGGGSYGGGSAGPDYGAISRLTELMGNPYMTKGQQAVAQAIIAQQLKSGDSGMTEYQRRSLQLAEQRLEQGTREGPKFYGNVQWAQRTNEQTGKMETVPYQIGSDGTVNYLDLGGATPLPNTRSADTGTEIVPIGPGGLQAGPALQKDVAGAKAQQVIGESAGAAAAGLPNQAEALARLESVGSEITNDPGLEYVLGPFDSRAPRFTQARADTQAKIDRFLGQTFPMAMDSLRGLGPASEREGIAAQAAIASLDQAQSPEQFKAVIEEALAHVRRGFEIAQQKAATVAPMAPAGVPASAPPAAPAAPADMPQSARDAGIDPSLWQYMAPEDQALWRN